mgnify:CR=1 FL=1
MPSENTSKTQKILNFCSESDLEDKVNSIAEHMGFSDEQKQELVDYFQDHMSQLYSMSLEYSLKKSDKEYGDEERDYVEEEFTNQLNFWWLETQSEWVRLNNLSNFKSGILGQTDKMLQAKASVCSHFLNPVAKHLDSEVLESSMDFLLTLVKRSQLE